jgi:hypothetical protein
MTGESHCYIGNNIRIFLKKDNKKGLRKGGPGDNRDREKWRRTLPFPDERSWEVKT